MAFYSGTRTNQNLVFGDQDQIGNAAFAHNSAYLDSSRTKSIIENTVVEVDGSVNSSFGNRIEIDCGKIAVSGRDNSGNYFVNVYNLDGSLHFTIPNTNNDTDFGISLNIGCGRLIVGTGNNSSSTQNVYVYGFNKDQFGQPVLLKTITCPNPNTYSQWGNDVSIGCGRIAVGGDGVDGASGTTSGFDLFDLNGNHIKTVVLGGTNNPDTITSIGCGKILVHNNATGESDAICDLYGNILKTTNFSLRYARAKNGYIVQNQFSVTGAGGVNFYDLEGNFKYTVEPSDGFSGPISGDWAGLARDICGGILAYGSRNLFRNGYNQPGAVYITNIDGTNEIKIDNPNPTNNSNFGVGYKEALSFAQGKLVVSDYTAKKFYIYDLGTNTYDDYIEELADNTIERYL